MTGNDDLNPPAVTESTTGPPATANATPVISPLLGKRLATAVLVAGLSAAAVAAVAIKLAGDDASWWAGYRAASVVAVLAVIGSLAVIRQGVGKPLMVLPAMTMLLSAVRLGISLAGLIVAVKTYKAPPEPTGVMICGYYAVVLGVESFVIHRALSQLKLGPVKVEGINKP